MLMACARAIRLLMGDGRDCSSSPAALPAVRSRSVRRGELREVVRAKRRRFVRVRRAVLRELVLAHRVIERLRVRVKCLETTPIPDPRTIVPYRRALVVNRYQVEKVLQGDFGGKEMLVAQWGILDKTVVAEAKMRAGQNVELTLEKLDDHPELKGERQIVDVEGLELPWFYAVAK